MADEPKVPEAQLVNPVEVAEVIEDTNALVFIVEDRVALEVPNLGRIEFPEGPAESCALAMLRAVELIREGKAKHGAIIL